MKSVLLTALVICCSFFVEAQNKSTKGETAIDKILKEIRDFRTAERKEDSAAGRTLGSYKEEVFLKRHNFFKTIDGKLRSIDKSKLTFDEEINLELLEYDIEDEIWDYTYKAYLNPILSDEGFHT